MKSHSVLLVTCLLISSGCLAAGYILSGYWLVLLAFPLLLVAWRLTYKRSIFVSASILLSGYVILASAGIMAGLSTVLMLIACTTALVSWELLQVDQHVSGYPSGKTGGGLEKHHLNSLAMAASAGLSLSLLSATITLQLPFIVIALLVLMALGSLTYGMRQIMHKKR